MTCSKGSPPPLSAGADLAARFADLLGADRILGEDPASRAIDGAVPSAVIEPRTAEETARALALASDLGLGVGVLGGGTRRCLGNPPSRLDLVVSTRALRAVLEYEPADFVITAQAGISLAELAAATASRSQRFALDPPARRGSTLGGALSADASGPRRLLYGTARDLVIGLEAALPDGTVVRSGGRVVKNVAGYDFRKLFLGAIGTLGVITSASLKLHAVPEEEILVAAEFADLVEAGAAAARILRAGFDLEALDLVNAPVAAGVLGEESSAPCALLLSLAGPSVAAAAQAEEAASLCAGRHAVRTAVHGRERSSRTWDRLRATCLGGDDEIALRACVPPGETARFVSDMERLLSRMDPPRIVARAGNGIVTAILQAAQAGTTVEGVRALRERAAAIGGGVVIESAPRVVKEAVEVWDSPAPVMDLSRRVKEAFDPRGVMAPGRFGRREGPGGSA